MTWPRDQEQGLHQAKGYGAPTDLSLIGVVGEPRVNILMLNLALDGVQWGTRIEAESGCKMAHDDEGSRCDL